uniref:Uncharacterized protein n=1 Tax=Sphaerodactylus townsendi TaxID=933632 RepID=A0ACB8F8I3_9SAUR
MWADKPPRCSVTPPSNGAGQASQVFEHASQVRTASQVSEHASQVLNHSFQVAEARHPGFPDCSSPVVGHAAPRCRNTPTRGPDKPPGVFELHATHVDRPSLSGIRTGHGSGWPDSYQVARTDLPRVADNRHLPGMRTDHTQVADRLPECRTDLPGEPDRSLVCRTSHLQVEGPRPPSVAGQNLPRWRTDIPEVSDRPPQVADKTSQSVRTPDLPGMARTGHQSPRLVD